MGVIMHGGNSYTGSAVTPNPQSSATGQLEKVGIDGTIYEVGNKVTEGYYYDGKFYEYPVVVGLFLADDTTFVTKMIPYSVATPAADTLYYATDDSLWYMWDGSKYYLVTSGTGEIIGKKDCVYFDKNSKACYLYDGSAFQGIVDGTTVYDRTYSMDDHSITYITKSNLISVPTWVGEIETILSSAIYDHKTWIGNIVSPSNIHDRTYSMVDHEIVVAETIPSTIGLATWVGRIDTILQSAISDHATWIENLPKPMVFKGTVGTGGTVTALPVDGTATIGDTYKVITAGTYAGTAAKVGDTFICNGKTSSANTWEMIPSGDEPSGTVTNVAAGDGLITASGSAITTSGTIKTNLRSFTKLTNDSAAATETSGRIYPVALDKSGYLSVNVPWTNTTYSMTRNSQTVTLTPSSGTAQSFTLSDLINGLTTGDADPVDGDYYVSQYANGGTTTVTYHRRPVSKLYNYIKGKLGIASSGSTFLKKDGTWATPSDTKNTAGSTNSTSKLFLIGATGQSANPQTYSNSGVYATNGDLVLSGSVTIGGNTANTSGARMVFNSTTNSVDFQFVS